MFVIMHPIYALLVFCFLCPISLKPRAHLGAPKPDGKLHSATVSSDLNPVALPIDPNRTVKIKPYKESITLLCRRSECLK